MADQRRLMAYIGGAIVLVLLVVGITLAIVLTRKDSDADETEPVPGDSRKKLVIDHDGTAPDAFAISMALLYERYFEGPRLVALTTTYGHTNQAVFSSDRIRTVCNRPNLPIYDGSREPLITGMINDFYFGIDGLGDTGYRPPPVTLAGVQAAMTLSELSKKYPGELVVVALGPLTNIALAARADPDFIRRLHHLYIGAGHIHSDRHLNPEFNAAMDPEAYYILSKDSWVDKITFVPSSQVQTTLNVPVSWRVNTLGRIGGPIMEELNTYERLSLPKSEYWDHVDPATMAIALNEDIVDEFRNTTNSIGLEGTHRGMTTINFSPWYPNARTVYSANLAKYQKFLMDVFSIGLLT